MKDRNKTLQGRTTIVTGSGQNIGRAIALLFASSGANVVINGHKNREAIEKVAQEARDLGAQAIAVMADVSNPDAVQKMVDTATQKFGAVDIIVSNVSLRQKQSFFDLSIEDWHQVINTNLNSAFYLAKAVVAGMKERGWGRIIHISGYDGTIGASHRAHNVTCKGGLDALIKALATELAPYGITANAISPGTIDTNRIAQDYPDLEAKYELLKKLIPVRRLGTCEDIAEASLYLASDYSGFVNGQVINVNGGALMISSHLEPILE
ncbi:SDR family NAD(P)-dependent oxidoreductase [Calothrix sp. CCY 0018]|uniref:SDR family NAD(P)-dependent oxidoreductase n=1 Tax=Calothrix sp. CCY 0018 TaxID=3103864 RepID=UPI0039C6A90F